MEVLFHIFRRLIVLTIGLYFSGLVAGFTLFLAMHWMPIRIDFQNLPFEIAVMRLIDQSQDVALFIEAFARPIAVQAVGYWLVFVLITEILSLRSLLLFLFASAMIGYASLLHTLGGSQPGLVRAVIAASIAGGLVHWLIAGRKAGLRGRRAASPAAPTPRSGQGTRPHSSGQDVHQARGAAGWAAALPAGSGSGKGEPAAAASPPPAASSATTRTNSVGVDRPAASVVQRSRR